MKTLRHWSIAIVLAVCGLILGTPTRASAQEAALTGTVTDSTGGVLPGVVVRATNQDTGNSFEAVSDATGVFRIAARIGIYRVTAELSGFATVNKTGVQLLVGQTVTVPLQMAPATLSESVTVTGESPLIDTTSSTLGANIDPKQMQELPLNGRNWMDLALLAPGSRQNSSEGVPQLRQGYSQINVDGQQVTNLIASTDTNQPRYSRDAIAEFQVITNRFDASQGRSAGMIVNAITKSGTNNPSGTFAGYFRSDKLNSADPIQKRVLPYNNQQLSTTFGGPIIKDRLHYFGSFEYEREPKVVTYTSPYPLFNIDQKNTRREYKESGRVDYQFTPKTRLALRAQGYNQIFYDGGGATNHPSAASQQQRTSAQASGTLTRVIGAGSVNELKSGYARFDWIRDALARFKGGCDPSAPVRCGGTPVINLRGYTVGNANGQHLIQQDYSVRDDYTTSFTGHGRHDVKAGAEYIYNLVEMMWCSKCTLNITANNGTVPATTLYQVFPVWNDWSTWNLAPLSPITTRARQAVSSTKFRYDPHTWVVAGWTQDDWQMTRRLTINLGVRYDLEAGFYSERIALKPFLPGDLPYDKNNVSPRLGFAYQVTDKTVVRGGYGKFFTQATTDEAHQTLGYTVAVNAEAQNDGRPDFASNPYNGPVPSFAQALANACDQNGSRPGCLRREMTDEINTAWRRMAYAHQASIGLQRQIGSDMSAEANYVYTSGYGEERTYNLNLSYNPLTGANYPFSDISHRPFPDWGQITGFIGEGTSKYNGLETAFTKRFSHRWQGTATYTLAKFKDSDPTPDQWSIVNGRLSRAPLGFNVQSDIGGEYGLATTDQRHRAVFNGIWDMGYGFQFSGLYFYGSGQRFATTYGGDLRDQGDSKARLRPNGTIVSRNNFVGSPIHRVDIRVQKEFKFAGRRSVEGLVEAFNLFNHANYGSYTLAESNAAYGNPSFNSNIAYQARIVQLGFRLAF
jgi:hypothetical protein